MHTREKLFVLLFAAALLILAVGAAFGIAPVWQPGFSADSQAPLQTMVSGLIDLNTADATLLCTLPGVGKAKAEAILQDRDTNGPYTTVEDVARVKGIGTDTIASWQDRAFAGAIFQ